MSASSSTPNLHLPVFSDDDIPTWLGDWNDTVNKLDSIVAFKSAPATNGSNISGTITCIYNKVLKLMEIQGAISMTSGSFKSLQVIGTLPKVLLPKEGAIIKEINNAFRARSDDNSEFNFYKIRIGTDGQLKIIGPTTTNFTRAEIQGFIECSAIW